MASFLGKALPGKVIPFTFNGSSKSKLGWDFLGIIDSGRWKEWSPFPTTENGDGAPGKDVESRQAALQQAFYVQMKHCQFEIIPGPEKRMKWGVPDGMRDPPTGEPLHDDLLLSAALAAVLDDKDWSKPAPGHLIQGSDPLLELDKRRF